MRGHRLLIRNGRGGHRLDRVGLEVDKLGRDGLGWRNFSEGRLDRNGLDNALDHGRHIHGRDIQGRHIFARPWRG